MAIKVLVVDDRVQSAQALAATDALHGCDVTRVASWAEAVDTLTYQQLARSEPPALVLGPLAKDAIDALTALRAQGIDPPTALYTENRSQDQDQALTAQYRLRAILHKPFAAEDRSRLLGLANAPSQVQAPLAPLDEAVALPEVAAPPPLRRMRTPPMGSVPAGDYDDLTGSTRSSSVRSELPGRRPGPTAEADLPTGVQRLLQDPSGAPPAADAAARGGGPAAAAGDGRLSEPRSISVLIIDDRFGTAPLLVERVGAPGQRCHVAPSYQEALPILDRFMASSMGCELVVGPLSADGVAAVRDYRKRAWGTHVVFYTESATQSQDARLPPQYGCMAILRRAGMSEPLDSLIRELRHHPRQPPAVPQEPSRPAGARAGASPATTSGVHAPPASAPAQSPPGEGARASHDSRVAPPAGLPQRIRRSVLPPAAPATPPGRVEPGLDIEAQSGAQQPGRVVVCSSCRQEFVVTASRHLPVRCSHCQALNQP